MRIYFVGSHATGKTTMARYVARAYGIPMITEVARMVLAEMETTIDAIRADIDLVNEYQRRIFERQIEVEREKPGGFVSDRAFDNLAYTAEHACIVADLLESDEFARYMRWVGEGVVIFLRPHPSLVRHDGVRSGVDWESVVRIDGMVKMMLEQFRVRYLPVDTFNMQERVRAVEYVLGAPPAHLETGKKTGRGSNLVAPRRVPATRAPIAPAAAAEPGVAYPATTTYQATGEE